MSLKRALDEEGESSRAGPESPVPANDASRTQRSEDNAASKAKAKPHKRQKRSRNSSRLKRPGRPLSAYNLFFRDERQRLIDCEADIRAIYQTEVAPTAKTSAPADKFQTLVKIVSKRWNVLSKEDRKPYEEMAKVEMDEYRERVRQFHEAEDEIDAEEAQQTPHHLASALEKGPDLSLNALQPRTATQANGPQLLGILGAPATLHTRTTQSSTLFGVTAPCPLAVSAIGGLARPSGLSVQPAVAAGDGLLDIALANSPSSVGRQQQDLLSTYNRILSASADELRQVTAFLDVVKSLELNIQESRPLIVDKGIPVERESNQTQSTHKRQALPQQTGHVTQTVSQGVVDVNAGIDNIFHSSLAALAKQQQKQREQDHSNSVLCTLTTQQLSNVLAHQAISPQIPNVHVAGPQNFQNVRPATNQPQGAVTRIDHTLLPMLQLPKPPPGG